MKFISKQSNYRVVLRSGQPGSRMAGIPAVHGIYVKFEGGMAEINDKEHIKMALNHPAYLNNDFILSPEDGEDPYFASRKNIEPNHNMAEMKYGSVGKATNPKPLVQISTEQKEIIAKMARDMATKMYKEMVENNSKVSLSNEDINDNDEVEEVVHEQMNKETIQPVMSKPKHPSMLAPTPIEDTNSATSSIVSETTEPIQVERVDVEDVKINDNDDDVLVKIKHTPNSSATIKSGEKKNNNKK